MTAPARTGLPERTMRAGGGLRGRASLLVLNVLGGLAVLGSYAHGLATHPGMGDAVWGGVPLALRPLYTVNMLLAAAGYFAFSHFVFFRLDPRGTRIGARFGYGFFHVAYALILIPSALWMPLTFAMLESPGPALWLSIRAVLALVGAGSLALIFAVCVAGPADAPWSRRAAVAGALFFCLQTALLDALVWPAYFPAP